MSVRLTEKQESLQPKDIKFFDETAKIEKKQKNASRRKLIKVSAFFLLVSSMTGTLVSYSLNYYKEQNLLKIKEFKNSKRIDNVLKNLASLKEQSIKYNIASTSRISDLTKEIQLASMFNFNTNISKLEKSRVDAMKAFQVEYETVERNMKSLQRIVENVDNITDEDVLNQYVGKFQSLEKILIELEKGFENPENASKNSNQLIFEHFDSLKNLNKSISEIEQGLKDIKEEVVATVLLKVKSGDYNLNATSSALIQDIKEFSREKEQEVLSLYNEIKGSEFEKDFNQNDIIEARKSVTELENSIIQKVLDDQKEVEQLIAKISEGQELKSGDLPPQIAAAAPTVPATTNTSNSSGGWGPFEYYLLYNWLSGGSRSSPAMVASHTSNFAATSGRSLQRKENGAYVPPTVLKPNATKLMSSVAAAPNYNNYNVRNKNSYINSSLNNNWGRNDGNSQKFQQAQKKLNEVKLKGQRATSARQAEIRRVAEIRRAESQRLEAARRNSSSSSTYSSRSSSRSVSRSRGGRSGGG